MKHGKLEYACTPVRLPWEITEETLRENIEGSNYETIVTNLMTRQIGCDREDLCLNGDEKDDAAIAFETLWLAARDDLPRALSATRHYNRLLSLGFQPDLDFCLTPNRLSAACERAEDGWFYRI